MTGECRLTFVHFAFSFLLPCFSSELNAPCCGFNGADLSQSVHLYLGMLACKSHWCAPSHSIGISQPAKKYPFFMNFSKHEILNSIIKMVFPTLFLFPCLAQETDGCLQPSGMRIADCQPSPLPSASPLICQLVGIRDLH